MATYYNPTQLHEMATIRVQQRTQRIERLQAMLDAYDKTKAKATSPEHRKAKGDLKFHGGRTRVREAIALAIGERTAYEHIMGATILAGGDDSPARTNEEIMAARGVAL